MSKALVLAVLLFTAGCAPVTVTQVKKADFEKYRIPARIVVAGTNASDATAALVNNLSSGFTEAGFTVVKVAYVDGMLAAHNFRLRDLVNAGNFGPLRDIGAVDAIVLTRDFYGTELHFVDTASGKEIASGCWRTGYITVINEVINQIRNKNKKSVPRLCPVKIE
jgi:hypothetical protein